jgi:ABC-type multidrug transport system fused ATPase/permease subunit
MLFNDSIMNNIRYARITASDKEVYEACKAAAVHDKIMSFPDGKFIAAPPIDHSADFSIARLQL